LLCQINLQKKVMADNFVYFVANYDKYVELFPAGLRVVQ